MKGAKCACVSLLFVICVAAAIRTDIMRAGSIAGIVTDTGGSPLLEGAVVEAIQNLTIVGQDTTDSLGSYRIEDLEPGTYDVVASSEGYFPDTVTDVVVTDGCVMVDFELYPTITYGCIFGDVEDEQDHPLPAAVVQAMLDSTQVGEDSTDVGGHYRIAPVEDGIYDVVAFKDGYIPDTVRSVSVSGACVRIDFRLLGASAVDEDMYGTRIDAQLVLRCNPNPFAYATSIQYALLRRSRVDVVIHNLVGEKIRTLVDEHQGGGPHTITWDATDDAGRRVPSGTYFLRLTIRPAREGHTGSGTCQQTATRKVSVVR